MALQKKVYRSATNRSRGGGDASKLNSLAAARTPKDYSKQVRSHWGAQADEAQDSVVRSIKRIKTYG